jgi:protein-tyrosine phosphatase
MFNIFKKKEPSRIAGHFPVTIDIHSHILPGIDDGSPDIDSSLKLIKGLYDLGVRKSIATPHIIGDLYRNTPATINAALEQTKQACIHAGIDMELSAGAEYMLDDYFMELLRKKEPLLTLHKNLLLVEIPYTAPPHDLDEMLFSILTEGYQPVLAHPERYFFYHKNMEEYARLKEIGFLLQVNLLSLTGYYGKSAAKAAAYILENDLAALVGTDMHHGRHLGALGNVGNIGVFNKYLGRKVYNDLDAFE